MSSMLRHHREKGFFCYLLLNVILYTCSGRLSYCSCYTTVELNRNTASDVTNGFVQYMERRRLCFSMESVKLGQRLALVQ